MNIGDDVDDTADRIVTSFGGTYQSVSNRIVETVALGNHITTPQQQRMVPERTTSSVTSQQYGFYQRLYRPATAYIISGFYQQQYQYGSIPYVAPLYYGHDQATISSREQRFPDDIDDILSVMASVAGITQPHV